MPYIKPEYRAIIDTDLRGVTIPVTPGELNYLITKIVCKFIRQYGLNYNNIMTVGGVLHDVHMEFYRRIASQYEDIKLSQNGDVYAELIEMLPTQQ